VATRQSVTLVAVTKTHGPEAVAAAYHAGVPDVGENRVQEAESKMAQVTVPVRWHLIGHLQRNKAKSATRFALVHGLDSERLAEALNQVAKDSGVTLDVLMQVNVSGETTKNGVEPADVSALAERLHALSGLRLMGVMTMAPFDAPESVLRTVFAGARNVRTQLQQRDIRHPGSAWECRATTRWRLKRVQRTCALARSSSAAARNPQRFPTSIPRAYLRTLRMTDDAFHLTALDVRRYDFGNALRGTTGRASTSFVNRSPRRSSD
jgi:pyridoxal phosphate enzyme (YggS family)